MNALPALAAESEPRYDRGMTAKIAVSLPDHLVAKAKDAVARGEAASVSAYVAAALEAYVPPKPEPELTPLQEVLAEIFAETGGEPTPEERRWARDALGLE